MKTPVVLSVAVVANSVGSVCLARGMKTFEAPEAAGAAWLLQAAAQVVSNPWIILGVFLLIIFLASYMAALSWADLSFVLPATAPGYILTAILARIFLQEEISPLRWAGTVLIVTGTWLVARTYSAHGAAATSPALAESRADTD
ncbi:MAG: EamA family transporter [Terriglobia bacterium]